MEAFPSGSIVLRRRPSFWLRVFGVLTFQLLVSALNFGAPPVPVDKPANYPAWWFSRGVMQSTNSKNPSPSWQNGDYPIPDDFAAANVGQLKQMAAKAAAEMNANLPGGAGGDINSLIAQWNSAPASGVIRDDYGALNLGQLKGVATLFYNRLIAVNYTGSFPWAGGQADDYGVANVGQLKALFSFDVAYSTTNDGIPDWWALLCYGTTALNPQASDGLGDNLTILQAFQAGRTPDFYQGNLPVLTVDSGNNQTGGPGGTLPTPVVIKVTDAAGNPIANAPITLTISNGLISANGSINSAATTIRVNTDANGLATITVFDPGYQTSFSITATAQSGSQTTDISASGATDPSVATTGGVKTTQPPVPTPIDRPILMLTTAGVSQGNPAFRQMDNTQPVRWFLEKYDFSTATAAITDNGVYQSYTSNGSYSLTETRHPFQGPSTFVGHSELHMFGSDNIGTPFSTDASADRQSDGTWSGSESSTNPAENGPIYSPPTFEWIGYSPLILEQNYEYWDDYSGGSTGYYLLTDAVTLSNEYPLAQFAQDVVGMPFNYSGWASGGNPFSNYYSSPIAQREVDPNGWSCSFTRASYYFTVPKAFPASEPNPDYCWYEVFVPDAPPQVPVVSPQRVWRGAGKGTPSETYNLDATTKQQNGGYYLAQIAITESDTFPACQWRNVVGAGEKVTLTLSGLPNAVTYLAQWSTNATSDQGQLKVGLNQSTSATFRAGTTPGKVTITVDLGNQQKMSVDLTVKIPESVTLKKHGADEIFPAGTLGAGMWLEDTVQPTDVSFRGIVMSETSCPPLNPTGCFLSGSVRATVHNPAGTSNTIFQDPTARAWIPFWNGNLAVFCDHVSVGPQTLQNGQLPANYGSGGQFEWKIPFVFRLGGPRHAPPDPNDPNGLGYPFLNGFTATHVTSVQQGAQLNGVSIPPKFQVTKQGSDKSPVVAP